jgi:Icc-related predicted phosphoesterase
MRIYYISDLHLERFTFVPKIKNYKEKDKILLLAGDIHVLNDDYYAAQRKIDFFEQCYKVFGKENVYYIRGNHEYYNGVIQEELVSRINVNNVVGCTLYSKLDIDPEILKRISNIMDFRITKNLTPELHVKLFNSDLEFLTKNINKESIVMTHFLPSYKCINKKYKDSAVNSYFANNLDDLILEKQPKVWIHGHTHSKVDIKIGNTRVLCNPLGYQGYEVNLKPDEYLPLKRIDI